MSRIKRLVRPDTKTVNWKAAIPVLGLAAALLAGCANTQTQAPPDASANAQAAFTTRPVVSFKSCAKPVWPAESHAAGRTGTVTLEYVVSAEGRALDSRVLKSSGDPLLDQAARVGIAKCSFSPAMASGKPVQAPTQIQYVWARH